MYRGFIVFYIRYLSKSILFTYLLKLHPWTCYMHLLSPISRYRGCDTSFIWHFLVQPFFGLVGEAYPPLVNTFCYQHGWNSALVILVLQDEYSDTFNIFFHCFLRCFPSGQLEGQCALCVHIVLVVLFVHTLIL